jgi:hypothetical protein
VNLIPVPKTPEQRIAKAFFDLVKTQKELAVAKEKWPTPEPGTDDRILLEISEGSVQGMGEIFDEIVRANYPDGDLVN